MLTASEGLEANHSRRMFDFDYMEFPKFSDNFSIRRNGTRAEEEEYYDPSIMELKRVMDILNKYVLPIIIIIGIVGNMVSFLVYSLTPRLYRQSSNLYLAFLAIVDNLSLLCIFVVWFGWVEIHIFQENGWCQTVFYCTSVGSFLSAWTIVSFTCERWIVVFHPLKRHVLCTRKRALIVMTSLTVTSMILYSFSLFTTTVHHSNGSQVCGYSYFVPQQVSWETMVHVQSTYSISWINNCLVMSTSILWKKPTTTTIMSTMTTTTTSMYTLYSRNPSTVICFLTFQIYYSSLTYPDDDDYNDDDNDDDNDNDWDGEGDDDDNDD